MITFAFIGRLTPEKGFDLVLRLWDILSRDYPDLYGNIRIFVFGDGPLLRAIPHDWNMFHESLESFRSHLHENVYFGQRDTGEIWEFLSKHAEYTIMPSRFLETFGLVALESLDAGIPVIGMKKGGLTPFIADDFALREGDEIGSMIEIIEKIVRGACDRASILSSLDVQEYSLSSWRKQLVSFLETDLGNPTRILLMNDYLTPVGGAEIYTHFLKRELERIGKIVFLSGYDKKVNPFYRKVLFLLTPFSFWRGRRIHTIIEHFHPDMIWCQSIMRYIGPWGLREIVKSGVSNAITHHDLGVLSYKPSRVFDESDIPEDDSLGAFVRSTHTIDIFTLIAIFFKWCYLRFLLSSIKTVPLHFVPSHFMVLHLIDYGIEKDRIRVFPHTRVKL